jgi:hypothetical protein
VEGTIEMRKADLTDTETLCALQRLSPGTADWSEEDYRGVLPLEDTSCLLAEGLPRSHAVGFLLARTMPDEMETGPQINLLFPSPVRLASRSTPAARILTGTRRRAR